MRKPNIWKKNRFEIALILLIVILSLFICRPFFRAGYFPTHDGEWAVVRLGAMHRALLAGHFPVRWAGNLNFAYGYPLFLFTYPLPYYLGEIFNLIGLGLVNSVKLLFVLSVIFSGLSMFLLAKEYFGKLGGLVSAIFYLVTPFRLVDLYVRGSLGESLALALFPLLLLVFNKILIKSFWRWVPLGSLLIAALLLTHNVMALLFFPFLGLYLAFNFRKEAIGRLATAFGLGIGLSAFFLLPALVLKNLIVVSQVPLADFRQHFVNLLQLIMPSWGYGSPGGDTAFTFQLGWPALLGLIVALIVSLKGKNNPSKHFFFYSLLSLVLLVTLMLPVATLFWAKAPLYSQIDFPWRALGPAIFFLALSLGYLATKRLSQWAAMILVTIAFIYVLRYARPEKYINNPDIYYLTNEATTTSNDELMPIWVKEKPSQRPEKRIEVISGQAEVSNISFNAKKTEFSLKVITDSEIQINTIYFPGWQATIDQKPARISFDNPGGIIRLAIPSGQHQVEVRYKETPLYLFSDLISIVSGLTIIILLFTKRKSEK